MPALGWFCDGRLLVKEASKAVALSYRQSGEAALSDPLALYSRKIAYPAATEQLATEPASGNSCLSPVRRNPEFVERNAIGVMKRDPASWATDLGWQRLKLVIADNGV